MIVTFGITLVIIALIIICVTLLRILLQASVARKRRLSGPRYVDELAFWNVRGVRQAVQIRGTDTGNPVLLYLHGGPGWPMMPRAHEFQRAWETMFTVVQWDQRLGGKTLAQSGIGEEAPTIDGFVADGLDLVAQLQARFPGVPIILMGHSWGTVMGIEMVRRAPDCFAAYVAIGQVSNFMKSERYGYETVLKEAKRRNARKIVEALAAIPDYGQAPLVPGELVAVRKAYAKLGFANRAARHGLLIDMLQGAFRSPDYRWRDLTALVNMAAQTKAFGMSLAELPQFSARTEGTRINCPIIMVGGQYDLFTPTPTARAYFDTLDAPQKEFIEVDDLAHGGPLEKPAFFEELLRTRVRPLVDHVARAKQSPSHS
ncbi:alpha/beta hydrolase [Sphingomonas suaedae]|uniref:Proline iminopeptidase n=1 Tax=Sphingomonas suaedae TaxID=2599297 RepID=A0A518RHJ4_9SPHN|nr:alpha/beta hydrolase [Sphingomonas suaedae]QDX26911.1 alpha/beta hydrolase [Sphingomonas suaedae]